MTSICCGITILCTHVSNPSSLCIIYGCTKKHHIHQKDRRLLSRLYKQPKALTVDSPYSRAPWAQMDTRLSLSTSLSLSLCTKLIRLQFEGCGTYLGGLRHHGCVLNGVYMFILNSVHNFQPAWSLRVRLMQLLLWHQVQCIRHSIHTPK